MRWDESHESPDLIDRRGEGPMRGGGDLGSLLFLLPWLLRSPFGWVILVGTLVFYVGRVLLSGGPDAQRVQGGPVPASGEKGETPEVHFVSFVLDDVQET